MIVYRVAYLALLLLTIPEVTLAQTIPRGGVGSPSVGAPIPTSPVPGEARQPEGPREAPPQETSPPPITIPSTAPIVPFLEPSAIAPPARFEWHPFVTLAEDFSDNFRLTPNHQQKNFRTSLSPGFTLLINRPTVQTRTGLGFSVFHDSSTNDVLTSALLGEEVRWLATPRLQLAVADYLTRSDEPTSADQLSLRRVRRTFITNAFSITSDYLIGTVQTREYYRQALFIDEGRNSNDTITHIVGGSVGKTFFSTTTASVGYEYLTSSTSGPAGSDIAGHQVTAALRRQVTPSMLVGVSGGYATRDVTTHVAEPNADYQIWNAAVLGGYQIPGRWSLNGSIGVTHFTSSRGDDLTEPSTASTFSYRWARAVATIEVDRGLSETFAGGQNFGVVETQGATGSLSYPFSPAITGTVRAFYREVRQTGVGGGVRSPTEDILGQALLVSVTFLRRFRCDLEYFHTDRTGAREGSITENRARVALTAAF